MEGRGWERRLRLGRGRRGRGGGGLGRGRVGVWAMGLVGVDGGVCGLREG